MVYKKYIRKNGKLYGPYIYHSRRVDGKVISEYRGIKEEKNNKKNMFLILGITAFLIIIASIFLNLSPTGNITLDLGERVNQDLELSLSKGELIPLNSTIKISSPDGEETHSITELISKNEETGAYYLEGEKLSGSGTGIGFIGEKEEYPTVYFKVRIITEESSSQTPSETSNENETPETKTTNTTAETSDQNEILENNTANTSTETSPETSDQNNESSSEKEENSTTAKETTNEPENNNEPANDIQNDISTEESIQTEEETENSEETQPPEITNEEEQETNSTSGITGGAITNLITKLSPTGNAISNPEESEEIIQADITHQEEFKYSLKDNQQIEIIPGSVKTEEKDINKSFLNLEVIENKAIITTNYKEVKQGFGEEFLGKEINLSIDKQKIRLPLEEIIKIELIIEDKSENETAPEKTPSENISEKTPEIENKTNETENNTKKVPEIENKTNETEITIEENLKLNESKEILELNLGTSNITNSFKEYRDKIIVKMVLEEYKREYSYDKNLSEAKLNEKITQDKNEFIIDLAKKFSEKKFEEIVLNQN